MMREMSHTSGWCRLRLSVRVATTLLLLSVAPTVRAGCDDCRPRLALKTNLLHDAVATPDLGVELSLAKRWSVSAEGVWAWWSRSSRHRYWRIYGGWMEMRYWLGDKPLERSLTGHRLGVDGSVHSYDFEFGHKGWQSPDAVYGVGVSYGYSLRLNDRLNLDLGVRIGYSGGNLVKYHPQCGQYVCTGRGFHRYFGLTGLEVTLVWFPGLKKNNPDLGL